MRLVNQVLDVFNRQLPASFVAKVNEMIRFVQNSELATVLAEVASILPRLFAISRPEVLGYCEAFDKAASRCPIFIVAQAIATTKYSLVSARTKPSSLTDLFYSDIPSQKAKLLNALAFFLESKQHFQTFQGILPHLFNLMNENFGKPVIDSALSKLVSEIASSPHFGMMRTFFVQRIFPFVTTAHPKCPQLQEFSAAIPIVLRNVAPPIRSYSDFIQMLVSAKEAYPGVAKFYLEYVKWLLRHETDSKGIVTIILEQIEILTKIFERRPTVENAESLVEALTMQNVGFDPPFILLGKLAVLRVPLLITFVLVNGYVKKCGETELNACKKWFDTVRESYSWPEKEHGIELILSGKGREVIAILEQLNLSE
jgi:hypothetical protein